MFSKHWQRIIQYPGAARDLDKAVMGKKVAESGGVHFFNKYEEIQHIDTHGPPELLKNVVKECSRKKLSETSGNHLLTAFNGDDQKPDLSIATVELSSMTDVGSMLCAACYRVDGDSQIMLAMYLIMEQLEETIESGHNITLVENIVDDCVYLLAEAMNPLIGRVVTAEE